MIKYAWAVAILFAAITFGLVIPDYPLRVAIFCAAMFGVFGFTLMVLILNIKTKN